jgi:hypothetical protein
MPMSASRTMSQKIGRLCELCTNCFHNPRNFDYMVDFAHHANHTDLECVARGGCYVCIRVFRDFKKSAVSRNLPPVFASIQYEYMRHKSLYFKVYMGDYVSQTFFRWFDPSEYIENKGEEIPDTVKDPKCMALAKTWLQDCRTYHDCQIERRLTSCSTNPTRVLHVERTNGILLKARLHYPPLTEVLEYLTLSHLWGCEKFLTLTKENHDAFCRNIVLTNLSKTFQDALYVTAELGLRYIWIDSLCIIQNDPDDWMSKSKRMAQIYKNAVCNICAAATSAGTSGFLAESRLLPPHLPAARLGDASPNQGQLVSENNSWGKLHEAELYQRAWVLQEQVLVGPCGTHSGRR